MKYGIQTHLSHAPLPQKLEELREYLRREIKKELKVFIELFYSGTQLNYSRLKRERKTYRKLPRTKSQ